MPEDSDIQKVDRVLRQFFVTEGLIDAEDAGDLAPETRLLSGGILNSLTLLKLAVFIEKQFGVALGPRDLGVDNFGTFGALVSFVVNRAQATTDDAS